MGNSKSNDKKILEAEHSQTVDENGNIHTDTTGKVGKYGGEVKTVTTPDGDLVSGEASFTTPFVEGKGSVTKDDYNSTAERVDYERKLEAGVEGANAGYTVNGTTITDTGETRVWTQTNEILTTHVNGIPIGSAERNIGTVNNSVSIR